jgi:hypothetical protein
MKGSSTLAKINVKLTNSTMPILATLGDLIQIRSFLFVLHCPRWPSQVWYCLQWRWKALVHSQNFMWSWHNNSTLQTLLYLSWQPWIMWHNYNHFLLGGIAQGGIAKYSNVCCVHERFLYIDKILCETDTKDNIQQTVLYLSLPLWVIWHKRVYFSLCCIVQGGLVKYSTICRVDERLL